MREKLQKLDDYFLKLADAMEAWVDAWEHLNPSGAVSPAAKAHPLKDAVPNGKAMPSGAAMSDITNLAISPVSK